MKQVEFNVSNTCFPVSGYLGWAIPVFLRHVLARSIGIKRFNARNLLAPAAVLALIMVSVRAAFRRVHPGVIPKNIAVIGAIPTPWYVVAFSRISRWINNYPRPIYHYLVPGMVLAIRIIFENRTRSEISVG